MRIRPFCYFLLLLLITLLNCTSRTQPGGDHPIASVDGSYLYLGQALQEIPVFVLEQDSAGAVQNYAERWVRQQISLQHAERIGFHQSQDFKNQMDRYYKQALEAQLKEYILLENRDEIQVSMEEAQNYYQANKDRFMLDETYLQFRHLTTRTRTEAEHASTDIANGIPWEEVVKKYSVDPELQLRQSAIYWPESLAAADIPALNEYLGIMGITERSPVHFYEGQYHFVQLMDIKSEGESPELEWLIPQIQEWLRLEKSRRITNAYIRNLYLQADANNEIEIVDVSDIQRILSDRLKNQ